MDQNWERIESLFLAAVDLRPEERARFLDTACAGNQEIREEVESLLAGDGAGEQQIFDALENTAQSLFESVGIHVGAKIGDYEILNLIGSGGMGEVYQARDRRLARDVAIKVLPASLAYDPNQLRRFEQEAQAAAALNHPNILAVHQMGTYEGAPYLVSELLEGVTLREAIGRGPMPLRIVIDYGVQIAGGLAAAHEKGIAHRDLKPENLFVTRNGRVKILDFGLAKLMHSPHVFGPGSPTALLKTRPGMVMGTAEYMSPEQVRGQEADGRTDIFALGAILYEMLTGDRAFQKTTPADTMAAILNEEPTGIGQLLPATPPALQRVVQRCLEKKREQRFQSASDLAFALEALSDSGNPGTGVVKAVTLRGQKVIGFARVTAVAVVIAALLAAGSLYYRSHQARPLTDRDSIVLADFSNATGDSVFDDTLKQGLSVQLEQSPFLSLVSDRKVNGTLKLMGRSAGDRLSPEVTQEVCQRIGSKAMLTGSIAALGSQYVIGLKGVNCSTGEVLAEAQAQAANKEAVLKALDAAAISLRGKLGESLSTVQKYATPVEEATTPSLEALKAYSLGLKTRFSKGDAAALPFYKRAAELDPNFAMSYRAMSSAYGNLSEVGRAAENARKAYDLREKVSERERFSIEARYYQYATGELEAAAQVYELWQQTYPRDASPYGGLAFISSTLGNPEKYLEESREAVRLEPNDQTNFGNLGNAYMDLNRLDEAEAVFRQAETRKLESEFLLISRYQLAFLKGETPQMAKLASSAMGKPGTEDLMLAAQADTEGWYGKLKYSRELTRQAMDSAQHNDAKESAGIDQAAAALREVEAGNREWARGEAEAAVKLAPNRDVRAVAALVLARAGDTAGAERLAADLDKAFPLSTLAQRYWLPTIRAAVALEHKDPSRAIELLQVVGPFELGYPTIASLVLCPAYLRGEAYLALGDGNAAAAEFRKFVDHRGLVTNFPWGALARLGLARADALQSETIKAKAAYQEFFAIWKDADPDIPILIEARAEYARLQ
ncbi:MAG: protein kinase [Terriglobales bacterium]|jgi:serine/threonine protein kinase